MNDEPAAKLPRTRFNLDAGYQVEGNSIHYRFDATGQLTDEANADHGSVNASVVVTVTTPTVPDAACIERFGNHSATFLAHPYLREALASTAQRLGFPGVLLPILCRKPTPALTEI